MPEVYTIEKIAGITGARSRIGRPGAVIAHLLTDSRRVSFPAQSLFFAIKAVRDGHRFIGEAWQKGIRNFVVSEGEELPEEYRESNFLYVPDTLEALQSLASFRRNEFDYPLIGVTGSNGKTIVKEWLFQLLSVDRNIIRSPKSFNSQTGVPLSLWRMEKDYDLAIVEAGISRPGEMERLEKMIRPDIGILTNIGPAHDEGFSSTAQKIGEKLRLFTRCFLVIYQKEALGDFGGRVPGETHFTWSYEEGEGADLFIREVRKAGQSSEILAVHRNETIGIELPYTDQASIHNAITCWCLLLWLEYDQEEIRRRMRLLAPVSMRLELKQAVNHCSLINDSYNSDLGSLEAALEFLVRQHQHPRKTVILSDVLQTGLDQEQLYRKVNSLLQAAGVNRLIGIGEALSRQQEVFSLPEATFYEHTAAFTEAFQPGMFENEAILLKGARPFAFERIAKLLEYKLHDTVLEINLNAMVHNLNFYKSRLKPGTGIIAMVKAFSYGSGSYEVASMLQFHKVDYLAVAYADEGAELRRSGIGLPLLVMSPEVSSFGALLEFELEPEVYSFRILNELIRFLKREKARHYPVHLKLDTGMHRLGFEEKDLEELVSLLAGEETLRVQSVFSHLAASEAPAHDSFTREQIARFEKLSATLETALSYPFKRHIANSAAIVRFPEAHFDLVRLGIGLYGIGDEALQPVGTLRTTISQIREVAAGESVGYGRAGKTDRPARIATVKIGYADGYDRRLGNGLGSMLVRGKRAPVIGNVCMDMCMIDVTGIDCREGEEVIVFDSELRVEELAAKLDTIPYEILTTISQRVKRVYGYE